MSIGKKYEVGEQLLKTLHSIEKYEQNIRRLGEEIENVKKGVLELVEEVMFLPENMVLDGDDMLIGIFFKVPEKRKEVFELLEEYHDVIGNLGKVLLNYLKSLEKLNDFSFDSFIPALNKESLKKLFKILALYEPNVSEIDKYIFDIERYLKRIRIKNGIKEIDERLRTAEPQEQRELMKLRFELLSQLKRA